LDGQIFEVDTMTNIVRVLKCALDFDVYLTLLGLARQFIDAFGVSNPLYQMKFVYFWPIYYFCPGSQKHLDRPI
jgi:hypothetical protein